MKSSNKSQMLKLSLIASLLVVAPLLSSSLRGTYLYFIFNLLIIALGVEAGLLSSSSSNTPFNYDKETNTTVLVVKVPQKPTEILERHALLLKATCIADEKAICSDQLTIVPQKKEKVVEKCSSAKVFSSVVKVHKIKKCPSTPSIFFIGGGDLEPEAEELELSCQNAHFSGVQEFDEVVPSGQELYNKAEMFIGNFYKQLKMQREESWQRIHGLYNKAF